MQTHGKNSTQPKTPSAAQLGEISDLIVDLHTAYDNGLREFQEAIHFSIAMIGLVNDKHLLNGPGEKRTNVLLLLDLGSRLRTMEDLLTSKADSHE